MIEQIPTDNPSHSSLEQVISKLSVLQPELCQRGLLHFAQALLGSQPQRELSEESLQTLCAVVLCGWRHLDAVEPTEARLRVFNPGVEEFGWQCPNSVVLLHAQDKPFLIDSVRMALLRQGSEVKAVRHAIVSVKRGADGLITDVSSTTEPLGDSSTESLQIWEITRQSDQSQLAVQLAELEQTLAAIDVVVGDFPQVLHALQGLSAHYRTLSQSGISSIKGSKTELALSDWQDLIDWLMHDHFTFFGATAHCQDDLPEGKALENCLAGALGLLRTQFQTDILEDVDFSDRLNSEGVVFSKSSTRSPLHRAAYMDVIVFPLLNAKGELVGGFRLLGFFTAKVYNASCLEIPLIRRKVLAALHDSGYPPSGHDYKAMLQLLESFPRDELFQISTDELLETSCEIVQIQERLKIRLFLRIDPGMRFVSALIYTPRDRFSTRLRERYERVLSHALGASESSFTTYFSESRLARVHLILRLDGPVPAQLNVRELEKELVTVARDWCDEFQAALCTELGESAAVALFQSYTDHIPEAYKEDFSPKVAVADFVQIHRLNALRDMHVALRQEPSDPAYGFRIKIIHHDPSVALSDLMPVLENLGLKVNSAAPYEFPAQGKVKVCVIDFSVFAPGVRQLDVVKLKPLVEDTLRAVWRGDCDSDRFNHLVIGAGLAWHQVVVFRAYARYLKQLRFALSPSYMARVLLHHPQLTQQLMALFEARFDVDFRQDRQGCQDDLVQSIREGLKQVESLDEDTVYRSFKKLILATVRTNRYQRDASKNHKACLSFKIVPSQLPFVPKPVPLWEAFVYAPSVEGVHLRSGKIARGGIRWSDRLEDYRQEVLGLMKAQRVKNCAIVPAGAKGGFILKQDMTGKDRDAVKAAVESAYRLYIRGILDLIDNLDAGVVQPADRVVRYDEDDTYIVAAPDKGTATFSDLANEESARHGFWLGDAFASGGSLGYDHKVMGITAKTAWLAVEQHLRALDIEPRTTDFTVIGVGDMGGDVFGNGMLLSEHIKLIAAFNHKWIFIDPDPNPAVSFEERKRLFHAQGEGDWEYYDRSKLSAGADIVSRRQKSVQLSPEARQALGIEAQELTPDALIHHILQAPVDLLWSAGIGTYVKGSAERHGAVADKQNDELRVNADQLRCKAIGEGGNLGLTQAARIEFAARGGYVNTDFIDNVGGVACSDREVLLKIVFDMMVREGDLTPKQRNQLLLDLTDSVGDSVMLSARRQVTALGMATRVSTTKVEEHRRLIKVLEEEMDVDRVVENLPDDDELDHRRASGLGLTQPELAVVLAYTKLHAKEQILASDLPDDPFLSQELNLIFSDEVLSTYAEPLKRHPLRRHMIATVISNSMVNMIGIQYLQRMRDSTGATVVDAAHAFVAVRDIFQVRVIWAALEERLSELTMALHIDALNDLGRLLRRCARWLLRNRSKLADIGHCVNTFGSPLQTMLKLLPNLLDEERCRSLETQRQAYLEAGVVEEVASLLSGVRYLYHYLPVVDIAETLSVSPALSAEVFFQIGEKLKLNWMSERLVNLSVGSHWQALARESFVDDLETEQAALTRSVLQLMDEKQLGVEEGITAWTDAQAPLVKRWLSMVNQIAAGDITDYALYQVAIRELMDLTKYADV